MASSKRLQLFQESFSAPSATVYEKLKTKAFAGRSIPSQDVSQEKWLATVQDERAEYARLRDTILVNPYKEQQEGSADLVSNNPLAETKDSVWSKYFELQELQKEIMTDVERLAMEEEVLKQEATHEAMLRILSIWANLHPTVAYRQGMHEVLAPLFFVLHADSIDTDEANADPILTLWDRQFLEHDAYALFSMLMIHLTNSFAPPQRQSKGAGPPKPSGVVQRCERLQNELLREKDYQLYIHLQSCQVQPQLYAMKWIRLLLGREFHLDDVLLLWDAIFADHHACGQRSDADGGGLALLDWIMVAMVRYVRVQLLDSDNMGCLRRLMKYPPVEDVSVFVQQALALRASKGETPALPAPPRQTPPPPHAPPAPSAPATGTGQANFLSSSPVPRPQAQASVAQPPPPSANPRPFMPPEHQDTMPQSPVAGLGEGREESGGGEEQAGGLEGLCGGPMLSALSVLEGLLPPPSDPRHAPAAAAIARIHSFHAHVTGRLQAGENGQRRPAAGDPEQPPQQGMVGIGAWAGQRRGGGSASPSPAASPGGAPGGGPGRPGGGWGAAGEGEGERLGFETVEEKGALAGSTREEGAGGWEKVVVERELTAGEKERAARAKAAAQAAEEERRKAREAAAEEAAKKKKAAEEVAQKRKAALGMLLEPTSPGAVPAEEGKEEKEGFGSKELFGKPKLSKANSSSSSSKDLFGDDGDVSSWLNPK